MLPLNTKEEGMGSFDTLGKLARLSRFFSSKDGE